MRSGRVPKSQAKHESVDSSSNEGSVLWPKSNAWCPTSDPVRHDGNAVYPDSDRTWTNSDGRQDYGDTKDNWVVRPSTEGESLKQWNPFPPMLNFSDLMDPDDFGGEGLPLSRFAFFPLHSGPGSASLQEYAPSGVPKPPALSKTPSSHSPQTPPSSLMPTFLPLPSSSRFPGTRGADQLFGVPNPRVPPIGHHSSPASVTKQRMMYYNSYNK